MINKLSESITRKFIESNSASDWEVESDSGWVPIISSNKTIEYTVYQVDFSNGERLLCADTHILMTESGEEVFVIDSLGYRIKTKTGTSIVTRVTNLEYTDNMYDLSVDSKDHTYYTNNVLSHNTITTAAYILYYISFSEEPKTVGIVANKASVAREIMSRVQGMYESLPPWLQLGVKSYNKGSIEFENRSKIFTGATTASGLRSASCVTGDTKVCLLDNGNTFISSIDEYIHKTNVKILSMNGFKDFDGFIHQGKKEIIEIIFQDNSSIKATKDHKFLLNDEWVICESLKINDTLNGKQIVNIINNNEIHDVYDALNVRDNSSYYTNGVISHNCNLIYIDEFAIVPNNMADAFLASTYPTISSGKTTKIIITSTPLGLNHFYKFWTEAESNTNGFVPIRVHWSEHPMRDIKWAEEQKRLLGDVKFNQEVECNFLGSSFTLINSDILRWLTATPPIYSSNKLDVFEKPIAEHVYILVADVAKGVGGDYSAFQVLDVTQIPYKQVCKFRDNTINPLLYPSVIYKTATQYNTAYVLIEINVSEQVPHILYNEYEYDNILFVARTTKGQQVSMGFSRGNTTLGVNTDKKVKRVGCIALKALIEEKKLLICDFDTIDEINTFIEVKDSYAADDGKHDDLVMPLVLFGWFTTNASFVDFTDVNLRVELYKKKMDFIENEMIPIGFRLDGTEEPEVEVLLDF